MWCVNSAVSGYGGVCFIVLIIVYNDDIDIRMQNIDRAHILSYLGHVPVIEHKQNVSNSLITPNNKTRRLIVICYASLNISQKLHGIYKTITSRPCVVRYRIVLLCCIYIFFFFLKRHEN